MQNGACIFDDINGSPIPGIERFADLVDVDNPYPLTFAEQLGLTEVTAELSTSCYAGKFPGTVPSSFMLTYLQAHHLDLDFYDLHFGEGSYLETHRRHMADWH